MLWTFEKLLTHIDDSVTFRETSTHIGAVYYFANERWLLYMVYNEMKEKISDTELVWLVYKTKREEYCWTIEDACASLCIAPERYWEAWARVQGAIKKLEEEELLKKKQEEDEEHRKWLRWIDELRIWWDEEREQEEECMEELAR